MLCLSKIFTYCVSPQKKCEEANKTWEQYICTLRDDHPQNNEKKNLFLNNLFIVVTTLTKKEKKS